VREGGLGLMDAEVAGPSLPNNQAGVLLELLWR